MPKIVDHAERRDEIVQATRRVIRKHGLAGVTMRSIAAETGKSTGLINHYFDDKNGLLVAALEASHKDFDRQIHEETANKAPGRPSLRTLLQAALPRDEDQRVHWILWFGSGRQVPWGDRNDAVRAIQRPPTRTGIARSVSTSTSPSSRESFGTGSTPALR